MEWDRPRRRTWVDCEGVREARHTACLRHGVSDPESEHTFRWLPTNFLGMAYTGGRGGREEMSQGKD